MTKPIIRIHNVETNEIIDREMTDDEFEKWEEEQAEDAIALAAKNKILADKAILLEKLGITQDEAKLLLS